MFPNLQFFFVENVNDSSKQTPTFPLLQVKKNLQWRSLPGGVISSPLPTDSRYQFSHTFPSVSAFSFNLISIFQAQFSSILCNFPDGHQCRSQGGPSGMGFFGPPLLNCPSAQGTANGRSGGRVGSKIKVGKHIFWGVLGDGRWSKNGRNYFSPQSRLTHFCRNMAIFFEMDFFFVA